MQGTILSFNDEVNTGLISGHDGVRYSFTRSDLTSSNDNPKEGLNVDFDVDGKKAIEIVFLSSGEKKKTTAILLALFLGGLGIHKFYLGQAKMGIIYLLFCWTGIPMLIALVEFILLIMMKDKEFNKKFNS